MRRFWTAVSVLALLLCLCVSAQAQTEEEPQYGPMLPSPLTAQEKYELMENLLDADASFVTEAIQKGHISCQELTAYYLERIALYNAPYNCFITLCDDAMDQAAQRDLALVEGTAQGSLYGVPIVLKDNIDYKGYPTTNGAYGGSDKRSSADIVNNLLSEGAIVLGKTNMSDYAQVASHSTSTLQGATKNAYNMHLAPGGSSGGSAVAVSLNFAIAVLGTDTNASLRFPAVLNGCVALRVTFGSVSTDGVTVTNFYRDVPGVITRSVKDQALLLDGMTGTTNYAENLNENALQGAKIGVLIELSGPVRGQSDRTEATIDPEIIAAFEQVQRELESCGAQVVAVSMPNLFSLAENAYYGYVKEQIRSSLYSLMDKNGLDAVIYPTYLHTPQHLGVDENGKNWSKEKQRFILNTFYLSPTAKCPEIAIPMGNHSNGAGMGFSMIAKRNEEQKLLDLAYSYTLQFDHRQTPASAPDHIEPPRLTVLYASQEGQSGLLTDAAGQTLSTVYTAWTQERHSLPQITKEHCTFLGWSRTQDGSAGLVRPTDALAQALCPDFADESKTVILYPQWKKTVSQIRVYSLPQQLSYEKGQKIDCTGLSIAVSYADGSQEILQKGFYVTIPDGEVVTVFYEGKTDTFAITLLQPLADYRLVLLAGGAILPVLAAFAIVIWRKKALQRHTNRV